MEIVVGLDQDTNNTGLFVLDGNIPVHSDIVTGTSGDWHGMADSIVREISRLSKENAWGKRYILVQAEQVYFHRNVNTFRVLVSLLVRLEALVERKRYWEFMPPVNAQSIDSEFEITPFYSSLKGKKRRGARKKGLQERAREVYGEELGDHVADASLHALYAYYKRNQEYTVLLEE